MFSDLDFGLTSAFKPDQLLFFGDDTLIKIRHIAAVVGKGTEIEVVLASGKVVTLECGSVEHREAQCRLIKKFIVEGP